MSFDKAFENRIKAILGEEFDAFMTSLSTEKITALRVNLLKANTSERIGKIKTALSEDGTDFSSEINWEQNGIIYAGGAPGKHPLHEAGAYYIQEPSAMSPVYYLDPKPGEKILDLCAAPGGKSTQIASKMNNEGILVSNEIDKKRAQILSLNIERCGIRNALITNMEPSGLSEVFEGYFDKILVDAPCSGEGMFRKNDEAIDNWSPENIRLCSRRQTDILKEAVKMLAPGGRLVYSTCTFAPEEDEYQAAMLLSWGMKPVKAELFEGMVSGDITNLQRIMDTGENLLETREDIDNLPEETKEEIKICSGRLWPHRIKGEGHFFAIFEKEGDISLNADLYGINGKVRTVNVDNIKPFSEFADDFLSDICVVPDENGKRKKASCRLEGELKGVPFMFGDQLYLAPEGMPGIGGITVMRPGLHLGTMKNGRFEPSHSLALALSKENVKHCHEAGSVSEAMSFIGGMSSRVPGLEKGWYLITIDGFSLGWAKYAGGILKNHYPKGLRIYT